MLRLLIFNLLAALCAVMFSQSSAFAATGKALTPLKRKVPISQLIYLESKGPKNGTLVCYAYKGKKYIATPKAAKNGSVSTVELLSTTKTKKLLKAAKAECVTKARSAQCNDGKDNDADGLRDYPLDPACSSVSDTTEDDTTDSTAVFRVFGKPFVGEYSNGSLFDHQYPLEFIHVDGVIVSSYEEQISGDQNLLGVDGHQGTDYIMDEGTAIFASYTGVVTFAGAEDPFYCPLLNQTVSGNSVVIEHSIGGERFQSVYAHFSSIVVSQGATVAKGQLLGYSGNAGCSTRPHLHFDVQRLTNTNGGGAASIDPSGWNGTGTDPWSVHEGGTTSFRLWADGEAPEEFRFFSFGPNPNDGDNASVAITTFRWQGPQDTVNPNNEFVELTLDPRYAIASTFDLSGYKLKNNAGEIYTFPSGTTIVDGTPIRVYSGGGVNTSSTLYWNRTTPAWSNNGDCARLVIANSSSLMYYLFYGSGCIFSTSEGVHVAGGGMTMPQDIVQVPKREQLRLGAPLHSP